jgi:signal recognition particle receptor subunit alpha
MLEYLTIFSRAGVVLFTWSYDSAALNFKVFSALDSFIKDVLLQDRTSVDSYRVGERLQVKWALANAIGVVVVGVYDQANANRVPYLDTLLKKVANTFQSTFCDLLTKKGMEQREKAISVYGSTASAIPSSKNGFTNDAKVSIAISGASIVSCEFEKNNTVTNKTTVFASFNEIFERLLDEAESGKGISTGKNNTSSSSSTSKSSLISNSNLKTVSSSSSNPTISMNLSTEMDIKTIDGKGGQKEEEEEDDDDAEMERLGISRPLMLAGLPSSSTSSAKKNKNQGSSSTPSSSSSTPNKKGNVNSSSSKSKEKVQRNWGTTDSFDETKAALLDMSSKGSGSGGGSSISASDAALLNVQKVSFSGTGASGSGANLTNEEEEEEDENDEKRKKNLFGNSSSSSSSSSSSTNNWFSKSMIGSWMSSFTGNKILTKEELEPIAETLRTHLMDKNVAKEVSDNLCDSLVQQLEGTKLEGGLTALTVHAKITAAVKAALRRAIERILTPKKSVDLLRDVRAKKTAVSSNANTVHSPFVAVFCGVNGVGKSTTLSKTAFHLKDNGFSVLIAACDSFRAGAVEQLKRHCAALDVPLYQQGYAKDPVTIAADAIKKAKEDSIDVVLIDTAGRMQNNQALMQQLARLVAVNKPDLVLFVGEALVGNDGVDQLVEFDRRLVDHAVDSASPRRIDGIVLTKFDTVDDKVGAALSMVYRTGIPVVFLGTGQQYPDLRRMNTQAVLNSLLA